MVTFRRADQARLGGWSIVGGWEASSCSRGPWISRVSGATGEGLASETAGLHPWHSVHADGEAAGAADCAGVSSVQPSGHATRSSVVTATMKQTSRLAMSRTTQYRRR